jgi:hypothetical protein
LTDTPPTSSPPTSLAPLADQPVPRSTAARHPNSHAGPVDLLGFCAVGGGGPSLAA